MYSMLSLLILTCFATSVYTIENEIIFEKCSSEIRKQLVTVNKCFSNEIGFEVRSILFNTAKSIRNNETTSEDFVAKYCPIFKKVYPCANLFTGGSNECKNEPRIVQLGTENNITTTLMLSVIDLVCSDFGATVVDQSITEDLPLYLDKQSESLRNCLYLFEDRPLRYRNGVQKQIFSDAVTITTFCLSDYFKAERKYYLKDLVVRLGMQFNQNLAKSTF